ncbi:MAG: hypothetical protein ABUL65_03130 [Opitutus sp.]
MIQNTLFRLLKDSVSPLAPVLVICATVGFQAGCASEPESHMVSAPPPGAPVATVMTTTTTSAPAPMVVAPGYVAVTPVAPVVTTMVVTQAPPALQQDVVLAQPTSQHVWIAGYYTWRNDRYEWMTAHWELPPSTNAVWVRPTWEQQGNAYKFTEGYWN